MKESRHLDYNNKNESDIEDVQNKKNNECHHSEINKLHYCIDCQKLVCFDCCNSKHYSHLFAISPIETLKKEEYLNNYLQDQFKYIYCKLEIMDLKLEESYRMQFQNNRIQNFNENINNHISFGENKKYHNVDIYLILSDQNYNQSLQKFISKKLKDVGLNPKFLGESDFNNKNYIENTPSVVLYVICTRRIHFEDIRSSFEHYRQKPNSKTFLTFIVLGKKAEITIAGKDFDSIAFTFGFQFNIIEDSNYTKTAILTLQNTLHDQVSKVKI